MGTRLNRWWALDWPERGQLLLIALTLPCIDLLLRTVGFRRLLACIERITPQAGSSSSTNEDVKAGEALAQHAAVASGGIPYFNTSCLRQSLLVHFRLRQLGFSPTLQVGIRPLPGKLDAHAWVELDGVALAQSALVHRAFISTHGRCMGEQPLP